MPVDPIALNLPNYFDIVKQPIDLDTIKKKLDRGAYTSESEFVDDMKLIFHNCYIFNPPDSDVVKLSRTLEGQFHLKWDRLQDKLNTTKTPTKISENETKEEKIVRLSTTIQQLQAELNELLRGKDSIQPISKKVRTAEPPVAVNQALTFSEKQHLSEAINGLSAEKMAKVIDIINLHMPELQEQNVDGEIELDIDHLDLKTLRAMQEFVRE